MTLATRAYLRATFLILFALSLLPSPGGAEEIVNVYSYREPGLVEPLLKAFTAKTGIRVNMVNPDAVFAGSNLWSSGIREERAAELGPRGEVPVHVDLRHVLGHQREQLVVGLPDRLAERVVVDVTHGEVFEEASVPPLDDPGLRVAHVTPVLLCGVAIGAMHNIFARAALFPPPPVEA